MKSLKFKSFKNKDFYKESIEIMAISNKGVALAIKESEEMGITTVHAIMDSTFYRMHDGSITAKSQFIKSKRK